MSPPAPPLASPSPSDEAQFDRGAWVTIGVIVCRFYRKKYNAEQALAQFAATARDEVELDKLTTALLSVIEEAVQPER